MATAVDSPKSARELYRIAKRQGVWDPEQIPAAEDRADWERLPAEHRAQLLKVCSLFYEGEVSVADTLAGHCLPARRAALARNRSFLSPAHVLPKSQWRLPTRIARRRRWLSKPGSPACQASS